MSYYNQYEFVSPEPLFALIREELNSYFSSGSLDDTLFPLWTNRVLSKLTRGVLPIRPAFLEVEDGKAHLPENFKYPRQLWALENYTKELPQSGTDYVQVTASRIDTPDYLCNPCSTCKNPMVVEAIYKVNSKTVAQFSKTMLLSPGRVKDIPKDFPCFYSGDAIHHYEVDGRTLHTTIKSGKLYMEFYAEESDDYGFSLIPDDTRLQEAVEGFIKFKLFEMLYNQASDESFNQSRAKKQEYEQSYLEKFIIAETWMKKQTKEQKKQALIRQKNRFNAYRFK